MQAAVGTNWGYKDELNPCSTAIPTSLLNLSDMMVKLTEDACKDAQDPLLLRGSAPLLKSSDMMPNPLEDAYKNAQAQNPSINALYAPIPLLKSSDLLAMPPDDLLKLFKNAMLPGYFHNRDSK
jgi:hypothetical protein